MLAFIDDDVVPDRHWYAAICSAWAEHPDAGAMTGQILPFELETPAQIAFERRGGFRGGNEPVRYEGLDLPGNPIYPYSPGMFGAGANLSVSRSVAMRLGGFDDALDTGPPLPGGGDTDLMHRVLRGGWALVYEPAAVVFHRHRRDGDGLRRQYDSWGRSVMAFATKTYRRDPAGRVKLRRLLRWFFRTQIREARRATCAGDTDAAHGGAGRVARRGRWARRHLWPIGPSDGEAPSRPRAAHGGDRALGRRGGGLHRPARPDPRRLRDHALGRLAVRVRARFAARRRRQRRRAVVHDRAATRAAHPRADRGLALGPAAVQAARAAPVTLGRPVGDGPTTRHRRSRGVSAAPSRGWPAMSSPT